MDCRSPAQCRPRALCRCRQTRSEEHTSELQSPIDISYGVFCLKKKNRLEDITSQFPDIQGLVRYVGRAEEFIVVCFFFFNDPATTEIYTSIDTLSLHDALPI